MRNFLRRVEFRPGRGRVRSRFCVMLGFMESSSPFTALVPFSAFSPFGLMAYCNSTRGRYDAGSWPWSRHGFRRLHLKRGGAQDLICDAGIGAAALKLGFNLLWR